MLITLLLLCFTRNFINATIRTVSNSPGLPAQYSSVTAAMTASSNGDTLYLYGTDLDYGDITVTQQLVFIGTGPYPYSKLNTQRTYVSSFTLASGSDGTIIRGIFVAGILQTGSSAVNDITLKNLAIGSYCRIYGGNWLVENCVFLAGNNNNIYFEFGTSSSITIQGCSFNGFINTNSKGINNFIINNNLFIYQGNSFANGVTADITNNIFCKDATSGTSGGIYKNNLGCNNAGTIPNSFPNQNNVNSVASATAIFVSYTFNSGFDVSYDFHLAPGSPAIGMGFGGGDAGVYSGSSPVTSSQNEYFPNIPVIQYMILNNTSVPQGGNLNVKLKTFKQN